MVHVGWNSRRPFQRLDLTSSISCQDVSLSSFISPCRTSLIISHADHVYPEGNGHSRKNYLADSAPPELSNKFALLLKFQGYMADRLVGQMPYTYEDTGLTKGMTIVMRYLRMKHVIVFRLSNDVVQVSLPP